jgi:hypothetical protein
MGLQSVIKIRGKTKKLFALPESPFQWSNPGWIIVIIVILRVYRGFIPKGDRVLSYNIIVYQTLPKVLKDTLVHLGPYQTLRRVWYTNPGGEYIVPLPATIQI